MVILMSGKNKDLILTNNSRLYQRENAVDNVTFYIPQEYNGIDLSQFIATLYYVVNESNVAYIEILEAQETDKENFLCFKLPIKSKFTALAGTVTLHLTMTFHDTETNTSYILKTGELNVEVCAWEDYFRFTSTDSLLPLDNMLLSIQTEMQKLKSIEETYQLGQATDIGISQEDNRLHLKVRDDYVGDGVSVIVPSVEDNADNNPDDGVIDLEDEPEPTVIEL